jgi:hypothetical protein
MLNAETAISLSCPETEFCVGGVESLFPLPDRARDRDKNVANVRNGLTASVV